MGEIRRAEAPVPISEAATWMSYSRPIKAPLPVLCCRVAGVASHVQFAIRETRIDFPHHDDDMACSRLLHLFIEGAVLDVAVAAPSLRNPQRFQEGLHGVREVAGLSTCMQVPGGNPPLPPSF